MMIISYARGLLKIPVDFEKLIKSKLYDIITKYYKDSQITISVHPNKNILLNEILKSSQEIESIREKIVIINDLSIGINDCKLAYNNSCFEYNQYHILEEIESLITQFKL